MKYRKKFAYEKPICFFYMQRTGQQYRLDRYVAREWFSIVNDWLKKNKHLFNIPIMLLSWKTSRVKKGKRNQLSLKLQGLTNYIDIFLSDQYLCCIVVSDQKNNFIDMLYDGQIAPILLPDEKWVDGLHYDWYHESLEAGELIVADSLEELIRINMLEPLLNWINHVLCNNFWLVVDCFPSGGSVARVLPEKKEPQDFEPNPVELPNNIQRWFYPLFPDRNRENTYIWLATLA